MKQATALATTILFGFIPLLAFSYAELVLDTDGDRVLSGTPYYLGAIRSYSTYYEPIGINLAKIGKQDDWVTVQADDYIGCYDRRSIPVSFSIVDTPNPGAEIDTETPLEIKFTGLKTTLSTRWIAYVSKEFQRLTLGIGGPDEHPGEAIIESAFSFHKSKLNEYILSCSVPTLGAGDGINYLYRNITDLHASNSPLVLTKDDPTLSFQICKNNTTSDATRTQHPVL